MVTSAGAQLYAYEDYREYSQDFKNIIKAKSDLYCEQISVNQISVKYQPRELMSFKHRKVIKVDFYSTIFDIGLKLCSILKLHNFFFKPKSTPLCYWKIV